MSVATEEQAAVKTSRTDAILSATDTLIRVHDDWENDEKSPLQPSEAFETALIAAVETAENGDTPMQCRELVTALSRLGFEWSEYADGKMDRRRCPVGSFWAAFRAVLNAREGATPPARQRLEPVAELLAQGVTYHQIAHHIYGHHGRGPFLNRAGQPDVTLILQERDKPGSVIGDDWVHPADAAAQKTASVEMKRRLTAIKRRDEDRPEVTIDPATIEQLLREGQYPDVIARVKGTTLEAVLAEAQRLGIRPNERPDLSNRSANYDPHPTFTPDDTPAPQHGQPTPVDIKAAIIAADVEGAYAEAVAERLGCSPQRVRAVWRVHRASQVAKPADDDDADDDDLDSDDDEDDE